MRLRPCAWLLAGALLLSSTSRADVSPLVLAESLFQEGKRLMQAGELDKACPRLAESFRIDPAGGTLLALALCHERQGKTATAWAEYKQALALAQKSQRAERERAARERVDEIEKSLSRVRLVVPPGAPPAAEVRMDSVLLPAAVLGTPLPVDPGKHLISVSAPGFQDATLELQIAAGPSLIEVPLPLPAPTPAAPPASASSSSPTPAPPSASAPPGPEPGAGGRDAPRRSPLVLGLGAAGGVAVLGSIFLGGYAWSRSSYARDLCPDSPCFDSRALDANQRADRAATGANVALGVGLVALGSAAILWWVDRGKSAAFSHQGGLRF